MVAAVTGGFLWLKYKTKGKTMEVKIPGNYGFDGNHGIYNIEIYEPQEEVETTYDNGNRNGMDETVQNRDTNNLLKTMTMI